MNRVPLPLRTARDAMNRHDDQCGDCRTRFAQHKPRCAEGTRLYMELRDLEGDTVIPGRPRGPVDGQAPLW